MLSGLQFRLEVRPFVAAMDNPGAVCVDVLLLERDQLSQDVEAGAHKVDVAHLVIPDDAVNTFIVVSTDRRIEVYFYPDKGMGLHYSFGHGEAENIEAVAQKLETDWQIRVVVDCEQAVSRAVKLNFTELDGA